MPLMPLALIGCVVLFYKVARGSVKKLSDKRAKKSNKKEQQ
ncbi:hypothetical protein [Helicobacter sp. T3_23-1056]